jgi:hypothetical protein
MKKLSARDVKDLNLLKHYRIIRKWACKNNDLNDADLELLIYFDCMDLFTKHDFEIGTYSYSWDNRRWNRLLKEEWIVVWRHRKCKQLISKMYRIMLGEDDIPSSERRNKLIKGDSYTDKVLTRAIYNVNKDKER